MTATASCDPCGRTAPRDCVSFIPYESSGAAQSDTSACCRCRGIGPGECEGCTCEHCGKQQPTEQERETMLAGDPRLASMCWAKGPEHGEPCPELVRQQQQEEAALEREHDDFDRGGCPGCGGNCVTACR